MAGYDAQFVAFVEHASVDLLRFAWGLSRGRDPAEDLVQDALQQVYVRWRSIQGNPVPYAKKAIVHRHIDLIRRRRLIRFLPLPEGIANRPTARGEPDLRLDILCALERLAVRERTVVALRYVCDLPERDVADPLDVSVGTVKASGSRGIAKLRKALVDHEKV